MKRGWCIPVTEFEFVGSSVVEYDDDNDFDDYDDDDNDFDDNDDLVKVI